MRCNALADQLAAYHPDAVVSSVEPKAIETAQIVAKRLNIPFETVEGLHEHDRTNVELKSAEKFEASVVDFFAKPRESVFGNETADEAHSRFASAMARVIEKYPQFTLLTVVERIEEHNAVTNCNCRTHDERN